MRPLQALCLLGLFVLPAQAAGETRYVTDELRLSVYEQDKSDARVLKKIGSGARVTLHERKGLFAHITTSDGTEGWVKATFLTAEAPAKTRLARLEKEARDATGARDQMKAELEAARAQLDTQSQNARGHDTTVAELGIERDRLAAENTWLNEQIGEMRRQAEDPTPAPAEVPLSWLLAAATAAFIAGGVAAARFIDYRVRKRHGGFRVY